jgi:hypothetical protein
MEGLKIFFKGLFVSAFREYGLLGALAVALTIFALIFLLAVLKAVWIHRAAIKAWFLAECKDNPQLRRGTAGFLAVVAFSTFFLPSSPWVAALFIIGCIVLFVKNVRIRLANAKILNKFVLGILLCLGLTAGGMLHDIAFPPTARCEDGTYTSSSHHSGTCSWHEGVAEWDPDPWWQEMFR